MKKPCSPASVWSKKHVAISIGASRSKPGFISSLTAGLLVLTVALALNTPAQALVDSWVGGTSANWADTGNWAVGNNPPLTLDSLVFGSTTGGFASQIDNLMTPATFSIGPITFNVDAPAFTINPATPGTNGFTLTGNIVNSSANLQTINDNITTTATRTISLTSGGGNVTLGGSISGVGGGLTLSGTGILTLSGSNSYTGNTTLGAATQTFTTLVVANNNAFGTGTLNLTGTGSLQGDGTPRTISNPVSWNTSLFSIGGSSPLTFNGAATAGSSTGTFLVINNTALTTFAGGWTSSNSAGARLNVLEGSGTVAINSLIQPNSGATGAQGVTYAGTGTLVLSAGTGNGAVTGAGGAGGSEAIQVASGGAYSAAAGNSTLLISGSYTIGTAGVASLLVKGGDNLTKTSGTLSMLDGAINTLNINSSTASSTVLVLGNTSLTAGLNMEVGNNTADEIVLGATEKATVQGTVKLNITGIGGFSGGAATQSLTLMSVPGANLTAGGSQFTLSATNGNLGGYTTASLTTTTASTLTLTLGGYIGAPTTAYWGGLQGTVWNTLAGGTASKSNWLSAITSGTDTRQTPGPITNVIFISSTGSNLSTTLGADTTINSLTFNSSADTSHQVTIGGANTLTLNASGTNGITVNSGAGTQTITSNVALGSSQTWNVNNSTSNPLTVSGTISDGGHAYSLTQTGTGAIALNGNNTFTGGVTIGNGIVQLGNAGALNSTTPNSVTFAASSTGDLQLNGKTVTSGALSTNATPGTPIIENANGTPATLTVSQTANTTYAGTIRDGTGSALSLTKSGTGTLTLTGNNPYTGTTTVGNGVLIVNGTIANTASVGVNAGGVLTGAGTVGGAVTINTGGEISAGTIGGTGVLTLSNSLSIGNGGIGYFDVVNGGANDTINIGGGLTIGTGVTIEVTSGLTSGSYTLATYTGADPSLAGVTLASLTNGALPGTYSISATGDVLTLTIAGATKAIPGITITLNSASRVMANTAITVSGTITNTGAVDLSGTLTDGGNALAVVGLSPSNPIDVPATNGAVAYSGTTNSGSSLGTQSAAVTVSDGNADPASVSGTASISVLQNRVVNASAVASFGSIHAGTSVSGTTNLTSAGADNANTRVTVANAGADSNGISVTGGSPATAFNGSTSDSRTVSGVLSNLGVLSGTITLATTGEAGVTGVQSPVNVPVTYSAQVFSGNAAWNNTSSASWNTGSSWADLASADLGGAGAPGLAGALSASDAATFGDVSGAGATTTVSLNSVSPTLIGLTFNATATAYTIAPGSGGSISLLSAATPISVSASALTPTITAVLTGTGGISKVGSGTVVLGGTNLYTGATVIANGAIQAGATNTLPTTTAVTLGDATANTPGQLILGTAGAAFNQTVASLVTAGTSAANSVVGGNASNSTLTINTASADNFSGVFGGAGTNQNNLSIAKAGAGPLVLTGASTYTGSTTLTAGALSLGSSGALGSTSLITFSGGFLQFTSANTTDYSSVFNTGASQKYNFDTNGQTITLNTALGGSGNTIAKIGAGTLILGAPATISGTTSVTNGTLVSPDMIPSSSKLTLSGATGAPGIFQVNSATPTTYTPTLASNLIWNTNGGFAAQGSKLTINANGGAQLLWNVGSFMGNGTAPLVIGSPTSNNQVEFQNSFDFGQNGGTLSLNFNRALDIEGAAATIVGGTTAAFGVSGNSALFSGVISANTAVVGTPPTAGDLGNNGFDKTGAGTLILSASNTYSGVTNVVAGTVIAGVNALVGTAGAFGDGHTVVVSGSSLPGNQVINLGFANVNGSDGTTANNASPTVLIGGAFTVAIPVNVNNISTGGAYGIGGSTDNSSTFAGTITTNENLNVTQVATSGANALTLSGSIVAGLNAKTLTFANAGAVDVTTMGISNGIAGGSLGVTQAGSGVTTISANSSYTGATSVTGGKLVISGGLTGSTNVSVSSGATLGIDGGSLLATSTTAVAGTLQGGGDGVTSGLVGIVTVASSGTLAAGQRTSTTAAGTLTALGNVSFADSTSVLSIRLGQTTATDNDELALNGGSVSLNGATLQLTLGPNYAAQMNGFVYVIINGGAGSTGVGGNVFAQSSITISGSMFNVIYGSDSAGDGIGTGNDVLLVVVPEPNVLASILGGFGLLIGIQRLRRRQVGI